MVKSERRQQIIEDRVLYYRREIKTWVLVPVLSLSLYDLGQVTVPLWTSKSSSESDDDGSLGALIYLAYTH